MTLLMKRQEQERLKQRRTRHWISKKDFKICKRIFMAYDSDGTGRVTYQQFINNCSTFQDELVSGSSIADMQSIFANVDQNHDGELSFRELLAGYYPACSSDEIDKFIHKYDRNSEQGRGEDGVSSATELTPEQEEELEGLMNMLDVNQDGFVDTAELMIYCSNLGIDDATITEWFSEFDTNVSGSLDKVQFKEFFRKEWLSGSNAVCL
eukprot:TRINITY_DN528_c0_g1_i10.p1 TRINITY_DN528_c0_g1~~TRINITY_DN528_c0_g1_i10.p1  ORF type:complete len:209 (+),score=55.99 TRINITY_DN528_c0_g1_i10:120-746(+)